MFEKKKCKSCGENIKENWDFCPRCGNELKVKNIFEDAEKEFKKVEKLFGPSLIDMPKLRMRMPKNRGVSIVITSSDGGKPNISVKSSNGYKTSVPTYKKEEQKEVKLHEIVEEPVTKIQTVGKKRIAIIELPDVKKEDIEIKELEQSIEIKACVGNKCYFKLIPIKANSTVVNEEFENGILKLEIQN